MDGMRMTGCNSFVTLSNEEYEELLNAKLRLEVLRDLHVNKASYFVDEVMDMWFGENKATLSMTKPVAERLPNSGITSSGFGTEESES